MDDIIEMKRLPSGATVISSEAPDDTIGLEIGSNCIFFESSDLFEFIRFIKKVDTHFLRKP